MPEQLAIINASAAPVTVHLFGLGLLGANFLSQLVFIRETLWHLTERPLRVQAYDIQTVTPAHLGPYRLPERSLGQPLAQTLVARLNLATGLDWLGTTTMPQAAAHGAPQNFVPQYASPHEQRRQMHVFVSAVNTLGERQQLHQYVQECRRPAPDLWMDLGREGSYGHVILGRRHDKNGHDNRLPTFGTMYPDLMQATDLHSLPGRDYDLDLDGCVPELISSYAGRLLWSALQPVPITQHGYLFNLDTGQINALRVGAYVPRKKPASTQLATGRRAGTAA